jgi:hypothetical protein
MEKTNTINNNMENKEYGILAIKSENTKSNCLDIIIGAKYLPDNKISIFAYGYEGGGCWSDFSATILMDSVYEDIVSIEEYFCGIYDEDSNENCSENYEEEYENIGAFLSKYFDTGEDCNEPYWIASENCSEFEGNEFLLSWTSEDIPDLSYIWPLILPTLSEYWPFHLKWSEELI